MDAMMHTVMKVLAVVTVASAWLGGCGDGEAYRHGGDEPPPTTRPAQAGTLDEPAPVAVAPTVGPQAGQAELVECVVDTDCPAAAHARGWCGADSRCVYACQPGWRDANAGRGDDGCECRLRGAGHETCNGDDDDCDGHVDNRFRDGRIAVGGEHTCALDGAGRALCWGKNDRGQLGDATTQARSAPTAVASPERFEAIAAGGAHTCAVDTAGTTWCWGDNRYGQLGRAASGPVLEPTPVEAPRLVQLTAGRFHTCGLDAHGRAWCWGRGGDGQLGDGGGVDRARPVQVAPSIPFEAIDAGAFHTCAVSRHAEAFCWGANQLGQLGTGGRETQWWPAPVDLDASLRAISAGASHTCAVGFDGLARCWGDGEAGRLGRGSTDGELRPQVVDELDEVTAIAAGAEHTCARDAHGVMWCWGSNADGRLGVGSRAELLTRPVRVDRPPNVVRLDAGDATTCAIDAAGYLSCWGRRARPATHAGLRPAGIPVGVGCP